MKTIHFLLLLVSLLCVKAELKVNNIVLPICTANETNLLLRKIPEDKNSKRNPIEFGLKTPKAHGEVIALACCLETSVHKCSKFFFGQKECVRLRTFRTTVDTESCKRAATFKRSKEGNLVAVSNATFATTNRFKPTFRWPMTLEIKTVNFHLAYFKIVKYSTMKKHFHLSFEELSCHNNSCFASKWRFACLLNTLEREKTLKISDTSFFHENHDVDKTLLTFSTIQWKFLVVFASGWFIKL